MFDILQKVLKPVGPTGCEAPVAQAIAGLLKGHVDSMTSDVMGNLICVKNGKEGGKRLMLSAHMDHIGFIVTDVEKEGFLRVCPVGGIYPDMSRTRHIKFQNGVEGVVVSQPIKVGDTLAVSKHFFVDIGADSKEEALEMVAIGDCAVYAPDCFRLGKHRVASPAMDDRCACALLVKLMQELPETDNTIVAVFSTQEEVGLRGAKTAAYQVNPDIGLALDVTLWGDTPEAKIPAIHLGQGPAVKIMDGWSISSPMVREALFACAEEAGIAVQPEILPGGGTDAGAIQSARGGVAVGTLSIPCRYVHSACEVIDMRDMDGALAVLKAFVKKVF
ncbi:MAG: M20/M25/M40 family metallo-hydrolase [Clostridia bacterium]|nr:M20/M25/M40 family metallo-hydrolase [Clostridia bacterium]